MQDLAARGAALQGAQEAMTLGAELFGFGRTRDEVRDELVPWALGYSDPVRDRVEARQREAAGETSCVNPNDE